MDPVCLQAIYYVIASIGIIVAVCHYKTSNKKKVVSDTLEITKLLRDSHREYQSNKHKDEKYYFIELIFSYEIVCGLHNKELLNDFTKEFVEDFIIQNLEAFTSSPSLLEHLDTLRDDKGAMDEIRKFIQRNEISFNEFSNVKKAYHSP